MSDIYINVYDFQELEESFNYGLFMPPSNGKAGKFLDEERRLSEYALPGPIGYLEVSSDLYFSVINIVNILHEIFEVKRMNSEPNTLNTIGLY